MWRRWLFCGLLLMACKGQERAPAPVTAVSQVTTPSDAAALDAPAVRLDIACGPAMLSPRIPAPPHARKAKQRPPAIDSIDTQGIGVNDVLQGEVQGQGGGASINRTDVGLVAASQQDPRPMFGVFEVQGSLDKLLVLRYLRRNIQKLEFCFEQTLTTDPNAHGTTTLKLVIGPNGAVRSAQVSGIAEACIQKVASAIVFPKAADDQITQVMQVMTFGQAARSVVATPKAKPAPAPPAMDVRSWTPFAASQGLASTDVAKAAGDELVKVMPRSKLDGCFAGKTASERVMVQVAFDGAVIGARSGGSGDAQVDACIGASLIGLKVTAPPTVTELACDITRGDPQPWRVALESYTVLYAASDHTPQKGDNSRAFLIVVEPSTPASALAAMFERTTWTAATLVALKQDAGAPVFIGMGRDGRTRDADYAPLLAIEADGDSVKSCAAGVARGTAPKAEVATLLQTLAQTCDPKPCPASLSIALGGTMQDLATAADAARRAGLPRLELSTTGCP